MRRGKNMRGSRQEEWESEGWEEKEGKGGRDDGIRKMRTRWRI